MRNAFRMLSAPFGAGMSPADADLEFLRIAKTLELYGQDLVPVKDGLGEMELELGISHAGISVYRDRRRFDAYKWPNVLKISYKRTKFCLRFRNERVCRDLLRALIFISLPFLFSFSFSFSFLFSFFSLPLEVTRLLAMLVYFKV